MDPLGKRSNIVEIDSVTRWYLTQLPEFNGKIDSCFNSSGRFQWRSDLNKKVALWSGNLLDLNVQAIVNPTNEAMNDKTGISQAIAQNAGRGLEHHISTNLKYCKTGEAKLTEGYQLLSRHIIHTVGPRYNLRYTTAAESALFNCYRNILQIAREQRIESVAIPCVHSLQRGYPLEDGAHIAIRTVRRFLEKFPDVFDIIIFVLSDDDSIEVYRELFPLYFPRSHVEVSFASQHLPSDIGNEDGEPVVAERVIRIADKPMPSSGSIEQSGESTPLPEDNHDHTAFTMMQDDVDKQKRITTLNPLNLKTQETKRYERYQTLLDKAQCTDLSAIAALRCLYQSGVDRMGRPIIVFIGRHLPCTQMNIEKILLYFIQVMDPVVVKEYVIVYFHTLTRPSHRPDMRFLRTIYEIVDYRYKKNMKAFYVVHPTIWSKVATWFFTTFGTKGIKTKVQNLGGIEHLFSRVNPDQLDIPTFIYDYDFKINGRRYYIPSDREVRETMQGL